MWNVLSLAVGGIADFWIVSPDRRGNRHCVLDIQYRNLQLSLDILWLGGVSLSWVLVESLTNALSVKMCGICVILYQSTSDGVSSCCYKPFLCILRRNVQERKHHSWCVGTRVVNFIHSFMNVLLLNLWRLYAPSISSPVVNSCTTDKRTVILIIAVMTGWWHALHHT